MTNAEGTLGTGPTLTREPPDKTLKFSNTRMRGSASKVSIKLNDAEISTDKFVPELNKLLSDPSYFFAPFSTTFSVPAESVIHNSQGGSSSSTNYVLKAVELGNQQLGKVTLTFPAEYRAAIAALKAFHDNKLASNPKKITNFDELNREVFSTNQAARALYYVAYFTIDGKYRDFLNDTQSGILNSTFSFTFSPTGNSVSASEENDAKKQNDLPQTKPYQIKNSGTKNPLPAAKAQQRTIEGVPRALIGQTSTSDQLYAGVINRRLATVRGGSFAIAYYDQTKSQRVMYTFSLLPAIETTMRTPGSSGSSAGVPELKPGILIRTQMNHKKFPIPGAGPVYQNLGIDQQVMQIVGTVIGNEQTYYSPLTNKFQHLIDDDAIKDSGTRDNGLNKSQALYSNNRSHMLNSYLSAMQLNNNLVISGKEMELLLLSQMSAPGDDILKIRLRGFVQGIRFFIVRSDRVYYAIDFVITKFGFNQEERTQLNFPVEPEPPKPPTETPASDPPATQPPADSNTNQTPAENSGNQTSSSSVLRGEASGPNSLDPYILSQQPFSSNSGNAIPAGVIPFLNTDMSKVNPLSSTQANGDLFTPGGFSGAPNLGPPSAQNTQVVADAIEEQGISDILNQDQNVTTIADSDGNLWTIHTDTNKVNRVNISNSNISISTDRTVSIAGREPFSLPATPQIPTRGQTRRFLNSSAIQSITG